MNTNKLSNFTETLEEARGVIDRQERQAALVADKLAAVENTVARLREIVTTAAESKADFIDRVRKTLDNTVQTPRDDGSYVKMIPVVAYTTPDGEPTCARDLNCGKFCEFLRTKRLGLVDVCALGPEIFRNRNGEGWLMPHTTCPVHKFGPSPRCSSSRNG